MLSCPICGAELPEPPYRTIECMTACSECNRILSIYRLVRDPPSWSVEAHKETLPPPLRSDASAKCEACGKPAFVKRQGGIKGMDRIVVRDGCKIARIDYFTELIMDRCLCYDD